MLSEEDRLHAVLAKPKRTIVETEVDERYAWKYTQDAYGQQ
ncbi:hypothetical protein [Paenibacillus puerhi]|nr:hypothetical protein [Paenibacillus puerhi]